LDELAKSEMEIMMSKKKKVAREPTTWFGRFVQKLCKGISWLFGGGRDKDMQQKGDMVRQMKPPIFFIALMILGVYMGILTAGIWEDGDNLFTLVGKLGDWWEHNSLKLPMKVAFGNRVMLARSIFVYEFIVFIYIMLDLSKNRNYMRGKEYGTAKWASVEAINNQFKEKKNECWNRVYSNNIRISMDPKVGINNNVLAIGGSGVGKSFYFLTPNIYQANKNSTYPGSFVFTDPKAELLQKNGAYLRDKGYKVKVLNLVPGMMHESDRFNPLKYIRSEADIIKLINNIFANTTPQGASGQDPFWEKSELMLWDALFLIVWMEHEKYGWEMNMNTVLWLLSQAEVGEKPKEKSELDKIFDSLPGKTAKEPNKGEKHPAYVAYRKVMTGAADTKRSIIISANARMAILDNPEIRRILSDDDLDLASIGTGIIKDAEKRFSIISDDEETDEKGKKPLQKTALFCVIPDSDTSYNCIAGMMYTLLFQELYFQADFMYGGKLPVPVTFWLDEFANIALPKDFIKMLTTMRSRLISCVIIIQNLAQLKALFEKEWEEIPGNCDVCVYLGGNEQSTFEYISKNLGKKTIYKKSHGESKGHNGSSSTNEDALGRELMLPEEVRELDNEYCIVFVRGKKPIFDHKFKTLESPEFAKSVALGSYMHSVAKKQDEGGTIELATNKEIEYAKKHGLLIDIKLGELTTTPDLQSVLDIVVKNKEDEEKEFSRVKEVDINDYSIDQLLQLDDFSLEDEELLEVQLGLKAGLSQEDVMSYILYGDAERMRSKRILLETIKASKKR